MTPTFGSLFSGIGGLDLGLERAGLRCVWQVEINDFCRRVLARHWPNVRRHDDVRTFPPSDPSEWGCDVIAGGFPCKQTSPAAAVHGRRVGLAGADSGLWHEMLRVVRLLGPRAVVVENPPSKWLAEVEGGLAGAGYRPSRLPLSAAGAGAPHLRRRVFLVAHADRPGLAVARPAGPRPAVAPAGGAADRDAWLSALPGVLRVADGVPGGLEFLGGCVNEEGHGQKADPATRRACWEVLRAMWEHRGLAATSPDLFGDRLRDSVPSLPCAGGLAGWLQAAQADEELRRVWQAVHSEPFEATHVMQQKLLERAGQEKRRQEVASRKNRRERIVALGNAVVPAVAEQVGRRVVALLTEGP